MGAIVGGIAATTVIGLLFIEASMNPAPTEQTGEITESKIKVVASFYPLYEFTKNVASEKATVSSFVPIGVEPHDWEPSTGNLLALKESDIFVYNGGGLEPFVDQLVNSGEYPNILFVETTSGIELIETEDYDEYEEHTAKEKHKVDERVTEMHEDPHDHDLPLDPHIWLDPILAKHQVEMIKNALIKIDPENSKYYEDNAAVYSTKLDSLHSKIRTELSNCKKDTIVSFHNAFSYFAKRYGINTVSLSGIAPESEVTAKELKEIVDFVKENEISVIFAEELVDPKLVNVLAEEAGAQVLILSPLEGVSKEELEKGVTYLDKMEENLQNIKTALECQ